VRIRVSVRPNCRTEEIKERPDGPLLVKVKAPAREGKANAAVIRAVARHFGVPRTTVTIVAGHKGRTKTLEIRGRRIGS
jgi:uncharacterized protein (TIGR00251 family)